MLAENAEKQEKAQEEYANRVHCEALTTANSDELTTANSDEN